MNSGLLPSIPAGAVISRIQMEHSLVGRYTHTIDKSPFTHTRGLHLPARLAETPISVLISSDFPLRVRF